MATAQEKKIIRYRKENEFFVHTFHKLEQIKVNYLIKHPKEFSNILTFVVNNDIHMISKIDKRKANKYNLTEILEDLENALKSDQFIDNNVQYIIDNVEPLVKTFCECFYLSLYLIKKSNDKQLIDLCSMQHFFIDQLIYMNYPYIFKEINKYTRKNGVYRANLKDIENTTIEIIMSSIVKYDINKNNKFVTYMSYWIKYGIEEEITYILKDIKVKYNDATPINYRFIVKHFMDNRIQKEIDYLKKTKGSKIDIEALEIKKSNSYKEYIQRLCNDDINIFALFGYEDITPENDIKDIVNVLNQIISKDTTRQTLLTYLQKTHLSTIEELSSSNSYSKEIAYYLILEIAGVPENIYKKDSSNVNVNHIYLDSIPEKVEDDLKSHTYMDEYLIFEKLSSLLSKESRHYLEKFKTHEINTLPHKTKKEIKEALLKHNLIDDLRDVVFG